MKELYIGIKLSKVHSVIENEPDKYHCAKLMLPPFAK